MQITGNVSRPEEILEIQGHKMILDDVDSLRLRSRGIHEPAVTALVREKIKPGDVVLDIGAHIGYYTLIFAELVGKMGLVLAYEPNPETFDLLEGNILSNINGYRHWVSLNQVALWDATGGVAFWLNNKNKADNRCWNPGRSWKNMKNIWIPAIRLDDFLYKQQIDFIKMDIQGAEYRALLGMQELLKDNPQVKIVAEFSPMMLEGCGPGKGRDFPDLLQALGFKIWHIPEKGPLEPVDTDRLIEITPKSRFRNIYCERGRK